MKLLRISLLHKYITGIICLMVLSAFIAAPNSYEGADMLSILGSNKESPLFKDFRNFWLLDKKNENTSRGIKLIMNEKTGAVESLLLIGTDTILFGRKFSKCPVQLPFGISFNDDSLSLRAKLGEATLSGMNDYKFDKENVSVEATYSGFETNKIVLLKFSAVPKTELSISGDQAKGTYVSTGQLSGASFVTGLGKKADTRIKTQETDFKKAILSVFNAWQTSGFSDIKSTVRTDKNFWNYKFTYSTTIKIPGEKYNMLYNFPFPTSQTDFVAVIKESDTYDKSFEKDYEIFEKELLDNFPPSEGWVSSCLANPDEKKLSNIEVRNDKYGAVILDYTKNPKGRHVLYLRFLLFSS